MGVVVNELNTTHVFLQKQVLLHLMCLMAPKIW